MASYKGWMYLLLQSHLEFQVITPRTLSQFTGDLIILPDVKCVNEDELDWIRKFISSGKSMIVTAETGAFDESRRIREDNPVRRILEISNKGQEVKTNRILYYPQCPGKTYFSMERIEFNRAAFRGTIQEERFEGIRKNVQREIMNTLGYSPQVSVIASPFVSTQIARVGDKTHLFFANFKGLKGRQRAEQIPEKDVILSLKAESMTRILFLPFLGEVQEIPGDWKDGLLTCILPEIRKGAVVWFE